MAQKSVSADQALYIYAIPEQILQTLKPTGSGQRVAQDMNAADLYDDAALTDSESEEEASASLQRVSLEGETVAVCPAKGSPVTWFTSQALPPPAKLGVYTTMLPTDESTIKSIQLSSKEPQRTIAMFMVGGGHFAGAIISLNESTVSKCSIKATKGFHRYTTRRKQGGAQSANDNAKGAANSAGAQIRRYNEIALKEDIVGLFQEWKTLLAETELILIRASGAASRKLLYDAGLSKTDSRVRGFPINTRRATQTEIIRSFHVLTRVQLGSTKDDKEEVKPKAAPTKIAKIVEETADPRLVQITETLLPLIKRNKVPGVKTCLQENDIDVNSFCLEPKKSYVHTPTLLHFAAHAGAHQILKALLDNGADPTVTNAERQTPFELASDKGTRDAFRLWRGADHENTWNWDEARVPAPLTAEQVAARQQKEAEERKLHEQEEAARRQQELQKIEEDTKRAESERQAAIETKRGPGRSLALGVLGQSASADLNNLSPEMKKKIERERRARAAEARFGKA